MLKAVKRTPHVITSKVGKAKTTSDADIDELKRQFSIVEQESIKLAKDAKAYRDAVSKMLVSSHDFGQAYITLLSPMSNEMDLPERYPNAAQTIDQMSHYQELITDLKSTIQPELDLIDSRIIAPIKEYNEVIKKAKKGLTKRDHKLIDFDRFNNTYMKLRDKKDKSYKEEQNIFKAEQDYEAALQEYDYYNNLLKSELPRFLELTRAFISPLFHSFFYMQLNILYTTYGKLQQFSEGRFNLSQTDIEAIYLERLGETHAQMDALTITKRPVPTAKIVAERRIANGEGPSSRPSLVGGLRPPPIPPSLSAKTSTSSFGPVISSKPSFSSPPPKPNSYTQGAFPPKPSLGPKPNLASKPFLSGKPSPAETGSAGNAPPPYTPPNTQGGIGSVAAAAAAIQARQKAGMETNTSNSFQPKPKPPPPPPPSTSPLITYVTALYDFVAQADGDLSFSAGDRIELIKKTDSEDDWWTGKLNGIQGIFPGNYVQV